jgi:hypothetical protein
MHRTALLLLLAPLAAPALCRAQAPTATPTTTATTAGTVNEESRKLHAIFESQWEATARRHP